MRRRILWACLVAGSMAMLAPLLPAYPLTLLTQTLIAAMLAMSLDLLLGYTGLPSLGHAAYFGVGAYAVAILATGHQVGFAGCLGAGLVAAAITAAVFGLLAIRATGTYFLMITLALGMVMWGLAFRWVSLTQGDNGISGVPRPELGLPWSFAGTAALLLPHADRGDDRVGRPRAARVLAVRPQPPGHPGKRVPDAGARIQRVAAQVSWPS